MRDVLARVQGSSINTFEDGPPKVHVAIVRDCLPRPLFRVSPTTPSIAKCLLLAFPFLSIPAPSPPDSGNLIREKKFFASWDRLSLRDCVVLLWTSAFSYHAIHRGLRAKSKTRHSRISERCSISATPLAGARAAFFKLKPHSTQHRAAFA